MKSSVLIYKKDQEFNTMRENLEHPEHFLKNVNEQI